MTDTANALTQGQIVRFKGYSDEVTDPLLQPGDLVKIRTINPDGGLIIDMLDAKGNVRDDVAETDTLFPEEIEILAASDMPGTETQVDPVVEAADGVDVVPAAEEAAPAPAKGAKGKGKAAKATAAPKEAPVTAEKAPKGKAIEPAGAKSGKAQGGKPKGIAAAKAAAQAHLTGTAEGEQEAPEQAPDDTQTAATPTGRAADLAPAGAAALTQSGPRSELVRAALASVSAEDMEDGSAALVAARTLVNRVDETYYTLGGVLAFIKESGVYKSIGYDGKRGFADYCKTELGTDYRKAQYLIDLYEKVQAAGLNETRLREIGWSKAIQIVRVGDVSMDRLAEDFDSLVDYAKDHNRDDLISHIQTTYEVARRGAGAGGANDVQISTFIFKLSADAAVSAERALQHAKTQTGSDDLSEAFKFITDDWSMMTEGTTLDLETAIAVIETRFGVKLVAAPADVAAEDVEQEQDETEQA